MLRRRCFSNISSQPSAAPTDFSLLWERCSFLQQNVAAMPPKVAHWRTLCRRHILQ